MNAIYLVNGSPHRLCDCSPYKGDCPKGVKRTLATSDLSRCLIPAPDVMMALTPQSESAPIVPTKEMIEAGRVAIMGMLEPQRAAMPKPSIAELEAILNADSDGRNINIEPDGSITELTPRTTTASEVAKTAYEAMVAEATK